MKALIAIWIANRLGGRARELRRSLRDHQRREFTRIFDLEKRSRGLRLYATWMRNTKTIRIHEAQPSLRLPTVTHHTFHDNAKAAA